MQSRVCGVVQCPSVSAWALSAAAAGLLLLARWAGDTAAVVGECGQCNVVSVLR